MPAVPFLLAATAVVGTGASIYYGNKADKQQEQASQFQQQQSDLQAARQRREAIRTARIQMANTKQTGQNQGVSGSSSAQGGLASIFSQLNTNLSFLDQYKAFGDQASEAIGKARTYGNYASVAGDVANLSMQASGVFNGKASGGGSVDTIAAASKEFGYS